MYWDLIVLLLLVVAVVLFFKRFFQFRVFNCHHRYFLTASYVCIQ